MARKSVAESVNENAAVDSSTAVVLNHTEENMSENKEAPVVVKALTDQDEIEVVSLVSHVSYKDRTTGDWYEWENAGDTQPMTFDTLKRMHRECPRYFREMALRPKDERVVEKFGLKNLYTKNDYLFDPKSYTRANVAKICKDIGGLTVGMKYKLVESLQSMVSNGKLSDVKVIREVEKRLDIDLLSCLE